MTRRSPWMAAGPSGTVSATASQTSAKFQSVTACSLRCAPWTSPCREKNIRPGAEFRAWLAANPDPTPRQLAEAGYVAPHWPRPWGLGADPVEQLVIDDEMRRAGVRRPFNQIGIGWAGPTLIHAGTEAQKERYLLPLLAGEEIWCQLFCEPGRGLGPGRAVHPGRARRRRVGGHRPEGVDELRPPGRARDPAGPHRSRRRQAPRHLVLHLPHGRARRHHPPHRRHDRRPRLQRGVPRRGAPAGAQPRGRGQRGVGPGQGDPRQRAGVAVGGGRAVGTGAHRRRSASTSCGAAGGTSDAGPAPAAGRACGSRARSSGSSACGPSSAAVAGRAPGPEASVRKALADDHGQRVMEVAKDLAGAYGLLADAGPAEAPGARRPGAGRADGGSGGAGHAWPAAMWARGYLFSRALTIGGGTAEVQRNIIAERVLGLPHDVDVEAAGPGRSRAGPSGLSGALTCRDAPMARHHAPDEGGEGVGMGEVGAVGGAGDLDRPRRRGRARPARRWPAGGGGATGRRGRAPAGRAMPAKSMGAPSRRRSASSATRARTVGPALGAGAGRGAVPGRRRRPPAEEALGEGGGVLVGDARRAAPRPPVEPRQGRLVGADGARWRRARRSPRPGPRRRRRSGPPRRRARRPRRPPGRRHGPPGSGPTGMARGSGGSRAGRRSRRGGRRAGARRGRS